MVRIYDEFNGVEVFFEGNIKENFVRINSKQIVTTRGRRLIEYSRGVIDLNIEVFNMSNEDYLSIEFLFLHSNNNLVIEDLDNGKCYTNYILQGNVLTLDKHYNHLNNEYYYSGTIITNKV